MTYVLPMSNHVLARKLFAQFNCVFSTSNHTQMFNNLSKSSFYNNSHFEHGTLISGELIKGRAKRLDQNQQTQNRVVGTKLTRSVCM